MNRPNRSTLRGYTGGHLSEQRPRRTPNANGDVAHDFAPFCADHFSFFTSGHSLSDNGRKAASPGMILMIFTRSHKSSIQLVS